MNVLTKEEFEFCNKYMEIIDKIVRTSSCAFIPKEYIDTLKEINKKYHYTQCITCNSSIFLATNSLYKDYFASKSKHTKKGGKTNDKKGKE